MIKKIIFLILITISFANIAYAWHSKEKVADTTEKKVKTKDGKIIKILKKSTGKLTDKLNTDSKLTDSIKKLKKQGTSKKNPDSKLTEWVKKKLK